MQPRRQQQPEQEEPQQGAPQEGPRWGWAALLVSTTLASLATLLVAGGGKRPGDSLRPLGLSRAAAAAKLEAAVDASWLLGGCHRGEPLLPGLPGGVCGELPCLWSEAMGANIDLVGAALQPVHVAGRCATPRGGQGPPPPAPAVTIALLLRNSSAGVGARALLEAFLTANEAPSAEFLLVAVGPPGSRRAAAAGLVGQAARRLELLFGARVQFLEAPGAPAARAAAMRAARGEYVAIIDSHTLVLRGWLGAILETLQQQPRAAAAGPLVLGPGNAIVDGGGILDAQGRAAAYQRGQKPGPHNYYLREVDFLAPDCLVLRREAYEQLQLGWDNQFRTDRYRAADLALSARAAGWRVLLQPLALALSLAGNSTAPPAAALEGDRQLFTAKWGGLLGDKHCPTGADEALAAERHGSPRLVWIDDTPPEPDKDSGSVRSQNLLHILLAEGYHVTMLSTHSPTHLRYAARVRAAGVALHPKMDPAAWPLARNGHCAFDAALVSRRNVYMAARGQLERQCPGLPVIFDTVDLHFLREARDAMTNSSSSSAGAGNSSWGGAGGEGSGEARGWSAMQNLTVAAVAQWLESGTPEAEAVRAAQQVELRLIDRSALTLVVSPDEAAMIGRYRPKARVALVSNVHEVTGPPPSAGSCAGRSGLLFVGNMNHPPNRQALEALVLDVLPRTLRLLPWRQRLGLTLHVVASHALPDDLAALLRQHSGRVKFHGHLSDEELVALYNRTKVAVAPLLSGAGVKGKVNQAMKLRVPVVATPLAVEGTLARDGESCLVAADSQQFAAKVVQAYTDCGLWGRLADGGFRNVQRHFSLEAGRPALLQALDSVGVGPLHSYYRDKCQPLRSKLQRRQRRELQQRGG